MRPWLLGLGAVALLGGEACKIKLPNDSGDIDGDFPCETVDTCPMPDGPCLLSSCWEGQCVFVPAPEGTLPEPDQVAGDCKELVCDGAGNATAYTAQADLPRSDGNPCTEAVCDLDRPAQEPKIAGTSCGEDRLCTGTGLCGVCLPRDARCDGAAVETCDERGQWSEPVVCPLGQPRCSRAQCVGIAEVGLGDAHGCARFDDGSVACWGADGRGQLGQGAPTPAPWGSGFAVVAFGARHACGLKADRSVWCWGAGDWGQLGDGAYRSSVVPVSTGLTATAVAVGHEHSCALVDGAVHCWGRNDRGQLGSGTAPAKRSPPPPRPPPGAPRRPLQPVGDIVGAMHISVGPAHTCVRMANGQLSCWGLAPFPQPPSLALPPAADDAGDGGAAELEARKKASSGRPQPVTSVSGATALAAGDEHTCAVLEAGEVSCWGAGDRRRLGRAAADDAFAPVRVEGVRDVRELRAGARFTCALDRAGTIRCWGDNAQGQLGVDTGDTGGPTPIATLGPAASVHAGARFACALLADGSLHCWGDSHLGQLGTADITSSPRPRPFSWD